MYLSYGVVYRVTNLVNGKKYIGQTTAIPEAYWKNHVSAARKNIKKLLYFAMRKHGDENFTFEVIWTAFDKAALDYAEDFLIYEEKALVPDGYNLKGGGHTGKFSDEMRANHSKALKIALNKPEILANIKAGALKLGQRPEIKLLRSINSKAMHADPEFKERHRNIINQPEVLAKIGEGVRANHSKPEVKQQMSESQLQRFSRPEEIEATRQRTLAQFADPEKRARHKSAYDNPETQEKLSRINKDKIFYTDGTRNLMLSKDEPVPEGFFVGNVYLHNRWHVNRNKSSPTCPLCQKERAPDPEEGT